MSSFPSWRKIVGQQIFSRRRDHPTIAERFNRAFKYYKPDSNDRTNPNILLK